MIQLRRQTRTSHVLSAARRLALMIGAMVFAACGNIGPDAEQLHGTWVQDGPTQTDPALTVSDAVIVYAPDGTSTFDAVMTLTQNQGIPERFNIEASVLWTLQETILTRTLQSVTVTPDISTPAADTLAKQLEAAYRESPPGRLIIDTIDDTQMILIDGDTGSMLRYERSVSG